MGTKYIDKLISNYFNTTEIEYGKQKEAPTCCYKWCNKKALVDGYCPVHLRYAEAGVFFKTRSEERVYRKNEKKSICEIPFCKQRTGPFTKYCVRHGRQIKEYGFITTNGDGSILVDRSKSTYNTILIFRPTKKEWIKIVVDKCNTNKLKYNNFFISRSGTPTTYLKDGRTISVANYIFDIEEGYIAVPLNGDKFDLRRSNLEIMDNRTFAFIFRTPKVGKSKFRGIFYNNREKRWCCHIFQDNPDLEIKKLFRRKKDAIEFRNLIYTKFYGQNILKLLRRYCGDSPLQIETKYIPKSN